MSPPTPSLEGLPTELLQHIMCSLPAFELLSLVRTSKIINERFKAAEKIIINECINREIEPQLRFEAFVNHKALANRTSFGRYSDMRRFMAENLQDRDIILKAVNLRQAALMSELHRRIQYFTQDFISKALAKRPASWEASPNEVVRFERAFYNFDLYANLFYRAEWHTWSGQEEDFGMIALEMSFFLCSFSPTEIQQLNCAYDYLLGLLAPIGDQFATHDIEWANFDTKVIDWEESHVAASRVTFGILGISDIVFAKTYEDQYKAYGWPHLRSQGFIRRGLTGARIWPSIPQTWTPTSLSQLTPAYEKMLFPRSVYQDPDGGPEYAWRWTNQQSTIQYLAHQPTHYGLRQWAYVMWDKKRIEAWGDIGPHVTRRIWNEPRRRRGNTEAEYLANRDLSRTDSSYLDSLAWSRDKFAIEESKKRRTEIFKAGGRGWWSENDESKVVWEEGKPSPWDDDRKRKACGDCGNTAGGARCPPHELELKIPEPPSTATSTPAEPWLEFSDLSLALE